MSNNWKNKIVKRTNINKFAKLTLQKAFHQDVQHDRKTQI